MAAFGTVRARAALSAASCMALAGGAAAGAGAPDAVEYPCPGLSELEARGDRIGSIDIRQLPIFDLEPGAERQGLFRLADRLHIDTRDSVIESQLLFATGDPVSERRIAETERNLRDLRYIREPSIRPVKCRAGTVDLAVVVREVWTTNPGVSFGRSGGANSGGIKLEELNLLGLGKLLSFEISSDPDRNSYTLHWRDPDVRGSRWLHDIAFRDSDDGQGWSVQLERPFYSLDSRWSAGLALQQDQSVEPVYRLGERVAGYGRQTDYAEFHFGRSDGLREGWARRLVFGLRREHAAFEFTPQETAPSALPDDRRLDYPFVRIEGVQDDFETARNRNQLARTEDQHFGLHYALEFGWSLPALGADRSTPLLHARASRGWRLGADDSLFADGALTTRLDDSSAADSLLSGGIRFYHPTGPSGVFFAGVTAGVGHELDADHELTLGGDTGLRGYPLRYQVGSGTALMTLEQRYFTKRSLWRLVDVGAAVFFDMGRAWGESAFGPTGNQGLLKDIGFGLRLGSTRSALGNVVHVDVAFPLGGPDSISRVQFLVQTKRSF